MQPDCKHGTVYAAECLALLTREVQAFLRSDSRETLHELSQLSINVSSPLAHRRKELLSLFSALSLSILQSFSTTTTLFSSVRCSSATKMGAPTASKAVTHQLLAKIMKIRKQHFVAFLIKGA